MKTTAFILSFLFILTICRNASGQAWSEFRYFSFKAGLNHGFYSRIPPGEFDVLELNGTAQSLVSEQEKHLAYGLGYAASLIYNWDFRNDRTGLLFGFDYNILPQTLSLTAYPSRELIKDKIQHHSISPEIALKLGKNYYERQNYLTLGINYHYFFCRRNRYYMGKEKLATASEKYKTGQFSAFLSANWMYFYLQFNYMPGGENMQPYWFTTGFNLPLNRYSMPGHPPFWFQFFFRRILY